MTITICVIENGGELSDSCGFVLGTGRPPDDLDDDVPKSALHALRAGDGSQLASARRRPWHAD